MSTAATLPAKQQPTSVREFQGQAARIATNLLSTWVGDDRAKEAIGRISVALAASVASARDPSDFYDCTVQSIAGCIAISALTGIMPGSGPTALAYVVPQRARKGEQPALQYFLSHRGMNAMARRCGQTMLATPIGMNDDIKVMPDGEVEIRYADPDKPPLAWDDLRGVLVTVKELKSGFTLHKGWVPRVLIEKRRGMSRSAKSEYSPWHNWPIEMSIKTAMHYAIARGWIVIDDTEAARALNTDAEIDFERAEIAAPLASPPPPLQRTALRKPATNGAASNGSPPVIVSTPEPLAADEPPELTPNEQKMIADRERIEAALQEAVGDTRLLKYCWDEISELERKYGPHWGSMMRKSYHAAAETVRVE